MLTEAAGSQCVTTNGKCMACFHTGSRRNGRAPASILRVRTASKEPRCQPDQHRWWQATEMAGRGTDSRRLIRPCSSIAHLETQRRLPSRLAAKVTSSSATANEMTTRSLDRSKKGTDLHQCPEGSSRAKQNHVSRGSSVADVH